MNVTVTVPTMGNINPFLNKMIWSLNEQTYGDFKIYFIVPKKYLRDPLIGILEKTNLDFCIVNQENVGFENAMNTALKVSGDLNLNMDDDAYYFPNHVEMYVKLFQRSKAGMIFGEVNKHRPYLNRTVLFLKIQHFLNKKPLLPSLSGYSIFFNSSGFLSAPILRLFSPFNKLRLNSSPIGVNMGWIKEAIKNLELREYSRKGTINEAYIALNAIRNDFSVLETNLINVKHYHTTGSLSRGGSSGDFILKLAELLFSPLIVKTYTDIDLADFERTYIRLNKLMGAFSLNVAVSFRRMLGTVHEGVIDDWNIAKIKSKYNEMVARYTYNHN
jgi:hypothetical protein